MPNSCSMCGERTWQRQASRSSSSRAFDNLEAVLEVFGPTDTARAGILVDHMVPGSKESRIAEAASRRWPGAVLVLGHPSLTSWQAVKPARVGLECWPDVPRGIDIKHGTLDVLGWPHADQRDIAMAGRESSLLCARIAT